MKVRSLVMTFTTSAGSKTNVILQHVKENIAKTDVEAVANHLIATNLVLTKGGDLVSFQGAKITELEKNTKTL